MLLVRVYTTLLGRVRWSRTSDRQNYVPLCLVLPKIRLASSMPCLSRRLFDRTQTMTVDVGAMAPGIGQGHALVGREGGNPGILISAYENCPGQSLRHLDTRPAAGQGRKKTAKHFRSERATAHTSTTTFFERSEPHISEPL